MKRIVDQINRITEGAFCIRLNHRSYYITDSAYPMHDVYWDGSFKYIDDKVIDMRKLIYVEYQDLVNTNIKPFKKD